MNIYRCPECSMTALEPMWDDATRNHYRRLGATRGDIVCISDVRHVDGETLFVCPYCNKASCLSELTIAPKVMVKPAFDNEDMFTV
jgi:hypothetical protein